MIFHWGRRRRQLDERVEDARSQAAASQQRLDDMREQVAEPLRRAAQHNRFADLIRDSLSDGHKH